MTFFSKMNFLCLCVFVLDFLFSSLHAVAAAGEGQLRFLPPSPVFESLLADPREPHYSVGMQSGPNAYEGALGSFIELLQWKPGDGSQWGWGILGASFIALGVGDYTAYPKRIVSSGGDRVYNVFPERVSDWYLGTYFSQSSGNFSNSLEYTHVSSHLGDLLFDYVPRIVYTRESFRFTTSFHPWEELRVYAGAGYSGHIVPVEAPFFLHAGAEAFTGATPMIRTVLRGYFAYDLKIKDEAGGVVNHAFQWGIQWKEKESSRAAIRLALLYYHGNTEYGQFYKIQDDHWGAAIYFDP